MATTAKGIYYPTSSDNIAPLETHFSTLASSVNTALTKIAAGKTSTFTGPATVNTSVSQLSIPFGQTFSTIPTVTASLVGGSSAVLSYTVVIYGITTTNFNVKVYRSSPTGTAETGLSVHWQAIEV
nr:MAG TPA: hypothetical protein [Caudoviricetes sp.]